MSARAIVVASAAALFGCAGARGAAVHGTPSGRDGWLTYAVGALPLEAPASWSAAGDARRLTLAAPDGDARLEVTTPGALRTATSAPAWSRRRSGSRGGVGGLERARRHPSQARRTAGAGARGGPGRVARLGDRPRATVGPQYRIFFTAATPAVAEALEVWRSFLQGARIGGEV